jgi:hypothetical protein
MTWSIAGADSSHRGESEVKAHKESKPYKCWHFTCGPYSTMAVGAALLISGIALSILGAFATGGALVAFGAMGLGAGYLWLRCRQCCHLRC